MKKMNLIAAFVLFVLGAAMLQGQSTQVTRTWVSSFGSDANPCSRTAPCKTFAGALAQTPPGGEIDVLDPGSYGPVIISQAVTIDGGGDQIASIMVSSGNGIVVQAGANDIVTLRHLQVNGLGSGTNGIRFLSGKNLSIENCHISSFTQNGIDIALAATASSHIIDSVVKNVGGVGIRAATTSGLAQVGIDNTRVTVATIGIESAQQGRVVVDHSFVQHASSDGLLVDDATSNNAQMSIENSDISFNNNALTTKGPGAWANISHSRLSYNTTCSLNNGAANNSIATFQNNSFAGPAPFCGSVGNVIQQ